MNTSEPDEWLFPVREAPMEAVATVNGSTLQVFVAPCPGGELASLVGNFEFRSVDCSRGSTSRPWNPSNRHPGSTDPKTTVR